MLLNVDNEKLKELFIDFYILTKMRVILFDNDSNKLLSYPETECDFCELIKMNEAGRDACRQSDINAFQHCKHSKEAHMYICHNGLIEVVAPIKLNDVIIAYIMFGQIIEKKRKIARKSVVLSHCSKYNIDSDLLSSSYDKLNAKSSEQIMAAAKILESCACYLWISELIKVRKENITNEINQYIDLHIAEPLSVETICSHFLISRSKLFEISDKHFGMGISKYIRKQRIKKAISLLQNEHLSVKDLCARVGIGDYNYFSKIFKLETGLGIREYIKQKL